jgi:hypothetical protein
MWVQDLFERDSFVIVEVLHSFGREGLEPEIKSIRHTKVCPDGSSGFGGCDAPNSKSIIMLDGSDYIAFRDLIKEIARKSQSECFIFSMVAIKGGYTGLVWRGKGHEYDQANIIGAKQLVDAAHDFLEKHQGNKLDESNL